MITEFKLPELGENITEGSVVGVLVKVGDNVRQDQTLIELETDKATIEVPSPADGIIKEILVKEGDQINVGQLIVKIDSDSQESGEPTKKAVEEHPAPLSEEMTTQQQPSFSQIPAPQAVGDEPKPEIQKPVPAAPSVRRFAREIGIDVHQVPGSGPKGRISVNDVKAFAKRINAQIAQSGALKGIVPSIPLPDFSRWGNIERQPMNNIRRKTADHLTACWQTIPHVTQFDKTDITDLEALRKKYSKKAESKGIKLTITPFILKVLASALKNFPQFNASINMSSYEIIYKKYFHIGVAVDTQNGLIVPVIRDVNKKGILELSVELNDLAEKARGKKITLEEIRGGTFTVTNLGGIGGTYFTPIVNGPEVAILGISRARMEPYYKGNFCHPRLMLPLCLSYDHRIIDGADGAKFIRWICEAIEQPFLMDLEG